MTELNLHALIYNLTGNYSYSYNQGENSKEDNLQYIAKNAKRFTIENSDYATRDEYILAFN